MGHHCGQLGRQGHQEGFFFLIKTAALALLNNDNAQQFSVMNNGHAQKGMERLFAGFLQVTEFGVRGGII